MYFALPKFLFLNRPRGMQRKGLCTFGSRQDPTNTNTPSLQCCLGESQCNSGWDGFGDFRNSRYTVVLGKCIPHPKIGKMKILTPPQKKCLSVTLNRRQQFLSTWVWIKHCKNKQKKVLWCSGRGALVRSLWALSLSSLFEMPPSSNTPDSNHQNRYQAELAASPSPCDWLAFRPWPYYVLCVAPVYCVVRGSERSSLE